MHDSSAELPDDNLLLIRYLSVFSLIHVPSSDLILEGSMQVILAQQVSESGRIGTAIGIAQMSNAAMRSIAPALFSSLYSISLQRQLAGGNLVFYVLMGLNLLAICLSHSLPPRIISKSGHHGQS